MMLRSRARARLPAQLALAVLGLLACRKHEAGTLGAEPSPLSDSPSSLVVAPSSLADRFRGAAVIAVDGSSTVFPISEAVAEEFRSASAARVTIGVSGTGGGFKKFCSAEIAISGASRPIKPSEVLACERAGIEYIELPVAYDGISVVVHPANDWAAHMTVAELRALWRPQAQANVQRWNQVRSGWPDAEIHLFGPGVDSGTYDYFTLAVVGTEHASRGDFTSSEDDNVLVQGVSRDRLALGFFGYAYYGENSAQLRTVAIDDERDDNGKGPISVSPEAVTNGTYNPLTRPIFVYVSLAAAARPEVEAFIQFYLREAARLVGEVGYIALPDQVYDLVWRRFARRAVGSIFGGSGSRVGVTVESLLGAE